MLNTVKGWFTKEPPAVTVKNWRQGMWVVHEGKVGVLFSIDVPCDIHYVDTNTGETTSTGKALVGALRQATYHEIPAIRRGLSQEAAKELGYGS